MAKVRRNGHYRRTKKGKTWVRPHKVTVHSTYRTPFTVRNRPAEIPRINRRRTVNAIVSDEPTYSIQDPKTGKFLGSVSKKNIKKR